MREAKLSILKQADQIIREEQRVSSLEQGSRIEITAHMCPRMVLGSFDERVRNE